MTLTPQRALVTEPRRVDAPLHEDAPRAFMEMAELLLRFGAGDDLVSWGCGFRESDIFERKSVRMQQICLVLGVLVTAALVTSPADAQIPPAAPGQEAVQVSFDVASVKEDPARTRAGPSTMAMHPSGQFVALNVTLTQLIVVAYDVRPYQIVGGPDWMGNQFFDILAKAPDDFEMGHTKAMMRRLLEERFGLVVHKGMQPVSIYSLESSWEQSTHSMAPRSRKNATVLPSE